MVEYSYVRCFPLAKVCDVFLSVYADILLWTKIIFLIG